VSATILSSDDGIGHFCVSFRRAQLRRPAPKTLQVDRHLLRERQIAGIEARDLITDMPAFFYRSDSQASSMASGPIR
jgi:hypothetical protein